MASPNSKANITAFVLLLCICSLPTYTTAAKILGFFPEIMDTQLYIHCRIADVLAGMGHNVTVIAPSSNPILESRYHFMSVALPVGKLRRLPKMELEYHNSLWNHMTVLRFNLELSSLMLKQPKMRQWFVNAKQDDFDLVILSYQANDFLIGLATIYNCSVILSTTRKPTLYMHQLVGNPYELNYVPTEYWTIPHTKMEYIDTYMNIWKILWYQFFVLPVRDSQIKKYYCARKSIIRSYTLGFQLLMLLISLNQLHSSYGFQHTTTHLRRPKDILCIFATDNTNSFNYHMSIAETLSRNIYFTVTVAGYFPLPQRYETAMFRYIRLNPFVSEHSLVPNTTYHRYQTQYKRWQQFLKLNEYDLNAFLWRFPRVSFDLVILAYYGNLQHLKLAGCYNVPIILSFDTRPNFLINPLVGNPPESAYMPSPFQNREDVLNPFWERYKFWLLDTLVEWTLYWQEMLYDMMGSYDTSHFSCKETTLAETRNRIALIFTNHHFTQSLIRPNVPAIVEIGGIHIADHKQDPTPDTLRHINRAENGFIYVNLGSTYNCTDVSRSLANILYNYFHTYRIFVVWRWPYCVRPRTSPFIHYQNWVEQSALLSNPDLKVFITHGSQNSLTEGIHYNVSMLAITRTPEQEANVEYLTAQGAMLHLKEEVVTTHLLHFNLYNLVYDPNFKKVSKTISEKYRDRPLTPRQTVLYWVNYVLRYRGAVHLRSPAVDMHYFQRIGLDFVLVTLAILFALHIAFARMGKWLKQPPPLIRHNYDYLMANSVALHKIDETQNYQIRPISSDETAGEETAAEETAAEEKAEEEAVREESPGPVMQPNRPKQPRQQKKGQKKQCK